MCSCAREDKRRKVMNLKASCGAKDQEAVSFLLIIDTRPLKLIHQRKKLRL